MIPLVDVHCHLFAGLDDGPETQEKAVEMCRIAWEQGTRYIAATAHQNESWREVTPDAIRRAAGLLKEELADAGLPLGICPCAEVMVEPDLDERWSRGELFTYGDAGAYLLIELPHGLYVDLRPIVEHLRSVKVRPILAHPELCPELLFGRGEIEDLVRLGCLVQASSGSFSGRSPKSTLKALRIWVERGLVHLIGSDGHSPRRRPPLLRDAYETISRWTSRSVADRICSSNGLAVVQSLPLRIAPPVPKRRVWWSFLQR